MKLNANSACERKKAVSVRRVKGLEVTPRGWNVSKAIETVSSGWTCLWSFCRTSVEIPFQLLLIVKTLQREDIFAMQAVFSFFVTRTMIGIIRTSVLTHDMNACVDRFGLNQCQRYIFNTAFQHCNKKMWNHC